MEEKATVQAPVLEERSEPFVLRWNELVSVTNWEKGRIICDWRSALVADGAHVTAYSDEAWAERVGNVTGQHVGRLRRTYERFGAEYADYPALYWSHFQVALDWDDAEMWLEGAVQNAWSVSQMRAKRWETLGALDSTMAQQENIAGGIVDDADGELDGDVVTPRSAVVRDVHKEDDEGDSTESADGQQRAGPSRPRTASDSSSRGAGAASAVAAKLPRFRPFESLPKLPDDVAEAFEQFKLVILSHKLAGWAEIARDDLIVCLEALQALALQPADD